MLTLSQYLLERRGKTMKLEDMIPEEVKRLSCYEVKTILEQRPDDRIVKMNLNENFVISNEAIKKLLIEACRGIDVRAYPPPRGSQAIKAISGFLGFSESEVSVGNGADELMDLLMKAFIRRGSKVLVVEPSFPMYTFFAELYGGGKVTFTLEQDFSLNVYALLERADRDTKVLFVCSPNNPTGNQFPKADIKKILNEFEGIVVVDEAYADFAPYSVMGWVRNYDNLVVLRSFSKSFGLAGLRLGYLVSNSSIVEYVQRVVGPFNVNSVAQKVIMLALNNWDYFKQQIERVVAEREWLMKSLRQISGIQPFPSAANFILFRINKEGFTSSDVAERLEKRNVIVKNRGHLPLLENCMRVTVGTRKMNEMFLSALKESLEE